MQVPGEPLTEGGIIGNMSGDPVPVTFRFNGREVPLSVHFPTGAWTVIVCWRCGDTRRFEGARCPACRPAPPVLPLE